MRTPHLKTDLSAAEVANIIRNAADLIDRQTRDLDRSEIRANSFLRDLEAAERTVAIQAKQLAESEANYENLLRDWNELKTRISQLETDIQSIELEGR